MKEAKEDQGGDYRSQELADLCRGMPHDYADPPLVEDQVDHTVRHGAAHSAVRDLPHLRTVTVSR